MGHFLHGFGEIYIEHTTAHGLGSKNPFSVAAPARQESNSVLLPLLLSSFCIHESHKDLKLIMV